MSKNGKFARKRSSGKANSKLVIVLSIIAGLLVILNIVMLLLLPRQQETTPPTETMPPETTMPTEAVTETTTVPATTIPVETEPVMLERFVEYYEENPDIAGWITIEGTKLDNPVMYVQGDNEKYLYKNFDGFFSAAGLPYIKGSCSMDPESDNLIIYGHNMLDGAMFGDLEMYADEKYWQEHPIIQFSTLYEAREYEIVAAIYDRLYYNYEETFKFYEFIDARDEAHFNEAITYFKENSEYDTGVTAEYGDNLITLVTCSYHCQNGRFVVVARQIVEEP